MIVQRNWLRAILVSCIMILALSLRVGAQCPPALEIAGTEQDARMGSAVASVGDVDADGVDDFAFAASGIVSVPGSVSVISGRTHQTIHTLAEPSSPTGSISFGFSIAGVGDINLDGNADILVGVRDLYMNRPGHAYVFSGADGSILHSFFGEGAKDGFGAAVVSAGDNNSDGINDFLIVAPLNDGAGVDFGRVYLFSGNDGTLLQTFDGHSAEGFGSGLAGGADLNGDGVPEIIVGASGNSDALLRAGKVYVYSGSDYSVLYTVSGADSALGLGGSLAFVGDLNGDGISDLAIGTPGHRTLIGGVYPTVGGVQIHSGVDGAFMHSINAPAQAAYINSGFGSVSGGGDVDGDGVPDIAIGAPLLDVGSATHSGGVFLYSGADYQPIREILANVENEFLGGATDIRGDYNQDGMSDVLTGAIENNAQAIGAGKAYLYTCAPCCSLAGDANHDFSTNIADVTFLIGRIFSSGPAPFCADAADANGDNSVNIGDATSLIARIFSGGSPPVCGTTGT